MNTTPLFAALCLLAMLVGGLCYARAVKKNEKGKITLIFKGGTTLIAALPALAATVQGKPASPWILAGIALCALADVVLELHFKGGMLAFALGHVCYIAAFSQMGGITRANWMAWAALSCLALVYIPLVVRGSGEKLAPFILYGLMISAMLASALTRGPLRAAGAALFVISDSVLLYGLARGKNSRGHHAAVMLSYWGAQYLIGLSALVL